MNTKFTNQIIFKNLQMFLCAVMLIIALIVPATAFSQSQGNPVSIAANDQTFPMATTDGSGGTIITWQDKNNGKYEIYAQRMNSDGNAMWPTNGIPICTQDSNFNPMIVSDGSGGAIIAWQSYRGSATADIFAQRVNSSGAVQWTLNGVPVCVVVFEQDTIAMVSDGLGGAILTWQDYRSNNGFADIYAQRVNPSGTMLWTANGVSTCNQAASQRGPKLINDGSGGAFITWYDNRAGNYDIYTQRISSGGAPMYTTNGVATCTMATNQLKPDICSDGAAGVIIVWYDYRSTTDFNIYAQRQGPALAIVWAVDGVVMNNNVAYDQIDPKIVSDGMGGAVISWTDFRTGTTADIYAQRVNSTGAVQWTATGVIICTAAGDQIKSQLVSDGNNGAYITWEDHRNVGNSDIYAQRIASNAAINWAATGYAICTVGNDQLIPTIVSNGNLGAIVVWQDYRSGNNFDIYEVGFNTTGVIAIENGGTVKPDEFTLSQNYPNPFNPVTVINYQLPKASDVKLSIYDALGQEVNILVNEMQFAGNHKIEWNASAFPSGVYFYRLEAESFISNKKMILIK
ncbi:MAG TPA: T9SS type A sorting domain-containing protein [Ignavibacteria bacterium]|nr:T9SS type A sorting domain-containing protein [Ignavibacteria bacterium]